MDFNSKILEKIPKENIKNLKLYRLGVFGDSSFELVELKKEADYPPHYHEFSKAEFFFVFGKGKIQLGEKEFDYQKGSKFIVPKKMKHGFIPSEDSLFLSIQTPPIKNKVTGIEDIHFQNNE